VVFVLGDHLVCLIEQCAWRLWDSLNCALGTDPQRLEDADLPEPLQHTEDLATLGQIGWPWHNPQMHRARRQQLRRRSADGHAVRGCGAGLSDV
jgi:hypothetical protein